MKRTVSEEAIERYSTERSVLQSGPKGVAVGSEVRRGQAERSAATRKLLLDATVKCLVDHGYGATTTILVAETAGVSRGAMLHQFPSKADLMAYVVEADFEERLGLYREILNGKDEPRERLYAYPSAVYQVLSRPTGVAMLEILQGSRSDPVLREKVAQVHARTEKFARESLAKEFPRGVSVPLTQIMVAVARGLSIAQVIALDDEDNDAAIELLTRMLKASVDAGVLQSHSAE